MLDHQIWPVGKNSDIASIARLFGSQLEADVVEPKTIALAMF